MDYTGFCVSPDIYHHGVKGMKWGVRKRKESSLSGQLTKKGKHLKRVGTAKKLVGANFIALGAMSMVYAPPFAIPFYAVGAGTIRSGKKAYEKGKYLTLYGEKIKKER